MVLCLNTPYFNSSDKGNYFSQGMSTGAVPSGDGPSDFLLSSL